MAGDRCHGAQDRCQVAISAARRRDRAHRGGDSLTVIREKTKIDRRVLYRMIERALRIQPDGRVWGFRALIPGLHTKAYERCKPAKVSSRGLAGAFTQLLDRHEEFEQLIRQLVLARYQPAIARPAHSVINPRDLMVFSPTVVDSRSTPGMRDISVLSRESSSTTLATNTCNK